MTPAEVADFAVRRALGLAIQGLDSAGFGPTYVGSWMDQRQGGLLRIVFTDQPGPAALSQITNLLPPDGRHAIDIVDHSLQQLQDVDAQINAAMDAAMDNPDPVIVSAGVDLSSDSVRVGVSATAPPGAEDDLTARYGSTVTVERVDAPESAGFRDIRSGRLLGGEWTHDLHSSEICSIGYSDMKSNTDQTYSVTAGHCGVNGTTWYQGLGPTQGVYRTYGSVHANPVVSHGVTDCDCAPVGPVPAGGYGTNQVLTNNNASFAFAGSAPPRQGDPVCQSGASSYEDPNWGYNTVVQCGPVQTVSYRVRVSDPRLGYFDLTDATSTNLHCQPGDSGAPFGGGPAFYGIVSGYTGSSTCFFSKVGNMDSAGLHASYAT